jgi:hypothetical protein
MDGGRGKGHTRSEFNSSNRSKTPRKPLATISNCLAEACEDLDASNRFVENDSEISTGRTGSVG